MDLTHSKEQEKVPCKWCGKPVTMIGSKMCNPCWQLDQGISLFPEIAQKILSKIQMERTMYTPAD